MIAPSGRLHEPVLAAAHRIVLQPQVDAALSGDLMLATRIDQAHVLMLAERGIVAPDVAHQLLDAIGELRTTGFAALRGRPAPRGWYLMYEGHLVERLGHRVGGLLHLGRSRNDLQATLQRLKLREPYLRLLGGTLALQACLLRGGRRHARVVMPAYTHYQAALPITYGHYLAAVAVQLDETLALLDGWGDALDRCPLGAGAAGGTTVPIDSARTAELLGFRSPSPNSLEAVASRDMVLRLLSTCAQFGVLLSRVSADLLLWTTAEFGLLDLPDRLTGSSSMMPQKRNVFLLEHVQGLAAAPLGAFVTAATAMHKTPFTNSIAVHTEGVHPVWEALGRAADALHLLRLVLANARPRQRAMRDRADEAFTGATELANRLVLQRGLGFREAHTIVGGLVREALADGARLQEAARRLGGDGHLDLEGLDPAAVAQASEYGGGPGDRALADCLDQLRRSWYDQVRCMRTRKDAWGHAAALLEQRTGHLVGGGQGER